MKKFLSLVLALIMTMSLVTISAGATEYRDLTDKDEIQYEEAVAVLNRIGVITGYEDGSFRPETELTRGAAAKIIVSLMIGPDAASALPNNASPYPDVPAGHTFAGVIGYCKTAGYISGYGDGTFKPANPLTGYAFAKMLLGAIGYKANIEGFVDTGWTMNVARIGNVAGLFDRISFDGAKAVTRDEACQLALNTLKATMVDYGGTNTVVSSNGQVLTVQGSKAQYVTSNNRDINANINRRVINATNNEMTLEFGEEHFKDLRLEHDKYDPAFDVYGHPSNEWSYKKVTIGTFKLPADFTYTKQMAHVEDTAASKEKALGLRGYDTWSRDHSTNYSGWSTAATALQGSSPFDDVTQIIVNGWDARQGANGQLETFKASAYNGRTSAPADAPTISEICDLTDNGVTVEVYVCPVDADFITHVVVTRTQLMEVRRVASDYVALDQVDSDSKGETLAEITGYNDHAIDDDNAGIIVDTKDSNYDAYNVLKELKAGDKVAVIPYTTDDAKTWEVGEAYVPEEVSGALTKSTGYATSKKADGNAIAVTVGGTEYPIAQWNKDLRDIDANLIKATKKDITLLLDKMGNALLAKDTGNANGWMVVCDYYQAPASNGGKVVWYAHGKSLDGKDDIDVNLGTIRGDAEIYAPGEIVRYVIANGGTGEYELKQPIVGSTVALDKPYEGVYDVAQYYMKDSAKSIVDKYTITSKNSLLPLVGMSIPDAAYDIETVAGTEADGSVMTDAHDGSTITSFKYQPGVYSGVKFIFVDFDRNGEVETFTVKDGVQNVEWDQLREWNDTWQNVGTNGLATGRAVIARTAEAYVSNKGEVKAVVIKTDSTDADLSNIILTTDTTRDEEVDENGVKWSGRKIARGSDGFKSEDTVLLDKFTEVGEFSRVMKETEDDGTKKIEVKKLGGDFKNRSVEPLKVYGILPVYNTNGKVNNSIGFRVQQGTGHKVTDLDNYQLTAAAPRSAASEPADFLSKTDVMGDSVLNVDKIEGLVRVDGTTKWLDLRDYQDDRIDSLKELVDNDRIDYDLDKVELRVLMNADKDSDGFRHAYLVAVIKAPVAANAAKTPEIKVTAALDADGTVLETKEEGKYVFEAPAGAAVYLVADNTNSGSMKSVAWSWKNGSKILSTENDVTVNAPKVVGQELTVTLEVKNTDVNADKGLTEKTTTATIVIKAVAAAEVGKGSVVAAADSAKGFVVNAADTTLANGNATVVFDINRSDVEAANWTDEDGNKTGWLPENADGTFDLDVYAINEDGSKTLINHANDTAIGTLGFKTVSVVVPGKIKETSKLEVKVSDVKWTTVDLFFDLSDWTDKGGTALTPYSDATNKSSTTTAGGTTPIKLFLASGTGDGSLPAGTGTFQITAPTAGQNGVANWTASTNTPGNPATTPTVGATLTPGALTITGVDPVVLAVTFSAVPTVTTYTVANVAAADPDADDTLTTATIELTAAPNSNLVSGRKVTVSAELSAAVDGTSGKYPLQVVASHPDFTEELTFVFVNDNATTTAVATADFTMPAKNIDLADCTFEVSEIKTVPSVTGVTLSDCGATAGSWDTTDEIVISFNQELAANGATVTADASSSDGNGNTPTIGAVTVNAGDDTVTVKLATNAPAQAGGKLVLKVTALESNETGYINPKTTTITILFEDLVNGGTADIRNFAEA